MPLDERQLDKFKAWLKSKNANAVCPSCGHRDWGVGDLVVAPKFEKDIVLGGEMVPMVQLICRNCSYVRLYAAVPIGLLEKEPEEVSSEKAQAED